MAPLRRQRRPPPGVQPIPSGNAGRLRLASDRAPVGDPAERHRAAFYSPRPRRGCVAPPVPPGGHRARSPAAPFPGSLSPRLRYYWQHVVPRILGRIRRDHGADSETTAADLRDRLPSVDRAPISRGSALAMRRRLLPSARTRTVAAGAPPPLISGAICWPSARRVRHKNIAPRLIEAFAMLDHARPRPWSWWVGSGPAGIRASSRCAERLRCRQRVRISLRRAR
jgi:hypothetical protein